MKRILASLVAAGVAVIGSFALLASPASAYDSDISVVVPAGATAGSGGVTYTPSPSQVAACVTVTDASAFTYVATAGTLTHTETLVDGCTYTATLTGVPAEFVTPAPAIYISQQSPDFSRSLILSAAPGIGNGVAADVTGDGIADVATVLWDTVIEHAPTVLGLLATIYVFFLGYRLLMLLISKTNGAFQGLMRRA